MDIFTAHDEGARITNKKYILTDAENKSVDALMVDMSVLTQELK